MIPTIPNIFFVIALAIATAYLTFLTTKGGLTDNRFSGNWKKLTKRGKLVLITLTGIGLLLLAQECNIEIKNKRKETETEKKDKERDSIITNRVNTRTDSSRTKLFNDISTAFAKQEFRLDTVKKNIERIRDSARSVVNNYPQQDPILIIEKIALDKKTDTDQHFSVTYKNFKATSTNFHLKIYSNIIYYDGSETFSILASPVNPEDRMVEDYSLTVGYFNLSNKQINVIHIYITGNYTNSEKTRTYMINDVFVYNSDTQSTKLLMKSFKQKVIDKIRNAFQNQGIKM